MIAWMLHVGSYLLVATIFYFVGRRRRRFLDRNLIEFSPEDVIYNPILKAFDEPIGDDVPAFRSRLWQPGVPDRNGDVISTYADVKFDPAIKVKDEP